MQNTPIRDSFQALDIPLAFDFTRLFDRSKPEKVTIINYPSQSLSYHMGEIYLNGRGIKMNCKIF